MISIIIPTSFLFRKSAEIRARLTRIVESRCFEGCEVIVAHGATGKQGDSAFRRFLDRRGIRYTWQDLDRGQIPIALLRNAGSRVASGDRLLFFDVDLAVGQRFVGLVEEMAEESGQPFTVIPCLYLSRKGSRRFLRTPGSVGVLADQFYTFRRDLIAFLAPNTSTLLISRERFERLGGFDDGYLDHGLEDFDLLLRAALASSDIAVPSDILVDRVANSPAFYAGFRSYLNFFSLPPLLRGVFTAHLWHPRPRMSRYYSNRENNRAVFERNVELAMERREERSEERYAGLLDAERRYDSVRVVHRLVGEYGDPDRDYSALFDNNPQHNFQPDKTWRRIRKRLLG